MVQYRNSNTYPAQRQVERFIDLDLDFGRNPNTNDVDRLFDEEAIKRSVRNLILTNRNERFFRPNINGGIRSLLFEPATPVTATLIQQQILDVLAENEPRVTVIDVTVKTSPDQNAFDVSIVFRIRNNEQPIRVTVALERLR